MSKPGPAPAARKRPRGDEHAAAVGKQVPIRREAYERIRGLCGEGDGAISRREIREALDLPDSTVRGWLQQLVELEHLTVLDPGQRGAGKVARYRLAERGPREERMTGLLRPEDLRARLR